jgi:hypothetical protein
MTQQCGLGVFQAEGYEDVVALPLEVVVRDRSAGSKLVEMMEPGHHLGLVDRFGAFLLSALLASFGLGGFPVVALSLDTSLVGALASPTHVNLPGAL